MLSNATVTAIDPSHGSMLLSLIELKSRYTRLVIVEIMIGNKAELKIMSPLSHFMSLSQTCPCATLLHVLQLGF